MSKKREKVRRMYTEGRIGEGSAQEEDDDVTGYEQIAFRGRLNPRERK